MTPNSDLRVQNQSGVSIRSRCFQHQACALASFLETNFKIMNPVRELYYKARKEGFHGPSGSGVSNFGFHVLAALHGEGAPQRLRTSG